MSTELISDKLKYHLTEIFKAVADACDGCEDVTLDIREAYAEALKEPEVVAFYEDLIENNPFNALIGG
jgi:hypothetical protein